MEKGAKTETDEVNLIKEQYVHGDIITVKFISTINLCSFFKIHN
jgi:hypothetical protein